MDLSNVDPEDIEPGDGDLDTDNGAKVLQRRGSIGQRCQTVYIKPACHLFRPSLAPFTAKTTLLKLECATGKSDAQISDVDTVSFTIRLGN